MRPIKFRAWDKDMRIMREVVQIHYYSKPSVTCSWNKKEHSTEMYDRVMFEGEYELMQYTGLWDVNGMEVYEGDILQGIAIQGEGGFDYKGVVTWHGSNMTNGWYIENQKGAWNITQAQTKISMDNITGEVIGNIHEHPYIMDSAYNYRA